MTFLHKNLIKFGIDNSTYMESVADYHTCTVGAGDMSVQCAWSNSMFSAYNGDNVDT